HNFRNKKTPQAGGETRYDRLMRKIIREGVKTRVLMLSATPVNNRMADLRNQTVFATEGDDTALLEHGISSIDSTTRLAQKQFNRWLELPEAERTPAKLVEMLGFDYFTLLDLLTIARSRKHIAKYYGVTETGRFPERLKPINIKADVDLRGTFPPIRDINLEIRLGEAGNGTLLIDDGAVVTSRVGTSLATGHIASYNAPSSRGSATIRNGGAWIHEGGVVVDQYEGSE